MSVELLKNMVENLKKLPDGTIIRAELPTDYGRRSAELVCAHKYVERYKYGKPELTVLFREVDAKSRAREASWFGAHRVPVTVVGDGWIAEPTSVPEFPWALTRMTLGVSDEPYDITSDELLKLLTEGSR